MDLWKCENIQQVREGIEDLLFEVVKMMMVCVRDMDHSSGAE